MCDIGKLLQSIYIGVYEYIQKHFILFRCIYDFQMESLQKSQAYVYACWTNASMSMLQLQKYSKDQFCSDLQKIFSFHIHIQNKTYLEGFGQSIENRLSMFKNIKIP